MVQPTATIRSYKTEDAKLVRFLVGKENMELLAAANKRVYGHPLTLAIWVCLSSVFIQFMNWWPEGKFGIWEYLRPLPALASMAVPIMFFVDWINRPDFEKRTQNVLKFPDMQDLAGYYSQSPSSGLWILEYGEKYIGFISVDASKGADLVSNGPGAKSPSSNVAQTASIRHFYVEEAYRGTGVQDDLLKHALDHAFSKSPALARLQAVDQCSLLPYVQFCLWKAGFQLDQYIETMGILRWKLGVRVLGREEWKKFTKTS